MAGLVSSQNCRICVALGLCDSEDPNPLFKGTLLHRMWICKPLEADRVRLVPPWLLALARSKILPDATMLPADLLLFTRALMPSLVPQVPPQPSEASFVWFKKPADGVVHGTAYLDGSLLDSHAKYSGLAAVRGWAVAVQDDHGNILAAAHGRPPSWAHGIHATELWSLLMAINIADPFSLLRTDCLAVHDGAKKGLEWANSPARIFGRAWGPIAAAFDGDTRRLAWMPAHCSTQQVGTKRLSNGILMTESDRRGNDIVDRLAKLSASWDQVPKATLEFIVQQSNLLTGIAKWIGQCGVLANHFPLPCESTNGKQVYIRDSEGIHGRLHQPRKKRKRDDVIPVPVPGDLSLCPRWAALRRRILDKEASLLPASHVPRLLRATCSRAQTPLE